MKPGPIANGCQGLVLAVLLANPLEAIGGLDRQVQDAVQARRSPALEGPMRFATDLGRKEVLLGGLLLVAVFTGPAGPAVARQALIAAVGTNLLVEGLKRIANRTRPDGEHRPWNSSFPSGHAATAASVAYILARRWPAVAVGLWALAAWVGVSRIYLNRHFLSDVLAAFAIGVAVSWLIASWGRLRVSVPGKPRTSRALQGDEASDL